MYGGKGGYSIGTKALSKNNNLYIAIGQKGSSSTKTNYTAEPTFNGGGGAYGRYDKTDGELFSEIVGSGGGATSIQSQLINDGQLKKYENNKNKVIIVAGGGGGACAHRYPDPTYGGKWCGNGGAGGGLTGIVGTLLVYDGQRSQLPTAGTQASAGVGYDNTTEQGSGGFGYGMNSSVYEQIQNGTAAGGAGAGGGGGWYGGGASVYGASAGGSGYIGGVSNGNTIAGNQTFQKPGGGTETGHSGNGYCIITYHPAL